MTLSNAKTTSEIEDILRTTNTPKDLCNGLKEAIQIIANRNNEKERKFDQALIAYYTAYDAYSVQQTNFEKSMADRLAALDKRYSEGQKKYDQGFFTLQRNQIEYNGTRYDCNKTNWFLGVAGCCSAANDADKKCQHARNINYLGLFDQGFKNCVESGFLCKSFVDHYDLTPGRMNTSTQQEWWNSEQISINDERKKIAEDRLRLAPKPPDEPVPPELDSYPNLVCQDCSNEFDALMNDSLNADNISQATSCVANMPVTTPAPSGNSVGGGNAVVKGNSTTTTTATPSSTNTTTATPSPTSATTSGITADGLPLYIGGGILALMVIVIILMK